MHGVIERANFDIARDDPAERDRESGLARSPVSGVRQNHGVGAQLASILVQELGEVRRAPLLFALNENGHAHRWPRVMRAQRARMHDDPAFVVGAPSTVEASILLDRLERIGMPKVATAGRLHVVMRIEKNGRRSRWRGDVPDDRGNSFDLDDLRLTSRITQDLRGGLSRPTQLGRIVAWVADRRNSHERLELGADAWHVFADPVAQRRRGGLRLHGETQPTPDAIRPRNGQRRRIDFVATALGTPATLTRERCPN